MNVVKLLVVFFLWALCFPLIELGQADVPPLLFATLRALLAGVVLLAIAGALNRPWPTTARAWVYIALIGLGATSLGFWGMFEAARWVSPGLATVVANIQPLVAAGLAAVFLKEPLSVKTLVGLAGGFVGILLIALPSIGPNGAEGPAVGFGFLAISMLGISISNVVIKHAVTTIDPLVMMGLQLVFGAIPLALASPIIDAGRTVDFTGAFGFSLFLLALPGTALAYWLWTDVLRRTELSRANAFSFLVPVIGLVLGWTFYNETLSAMTLLGAVVVVGGLAIANWPFPEERHASSK